MIDKENLAKRVEPLSKEFAGIIRLPQAEIEQLQTPFFQNGAIYRVAYYGPRHPIGFTVGCAGPDFTVLLPVNPEGFLELATRAGVYLASDQSRLAYVLTFLRTTRHFAQRFQILNSFSEVALINNPTPEHVRRYDQLKEQYSSVIGPPVISGHAPWTISVFALVRQDLARIEVKLSADGTLERSDSVLEKDMPIAYMK